MNFKVFASKGHVPELINQTRIADIRRLDRSGLMIHLTPEGIIKKLPFKKVEKKAESIEDMI